MTSLKMADINRMVTVNRYQDGGAVYLNGPSYFQSGANSLAAFLPEVPPNFHLTPEIIIQSHRLSEQNKTYPL